MANRLKVVAVSKLLLDQSNARLGEEQPSQQAAQIALAQLLGVQLLEIAQDIVEYGLDPTTLMAVTPEGAPAGRFRVIEGNRRLLALRSLDTPAIVDSVFSAARRRKLAGLSSEFRAEPIASVPCVVFDAEDEARHWIVLRHTGANRGIGLVEWDSNEQDRYKSRHGDSTDRGPAGQIIDFVDRVRPSQPGDKRIFTTLQRLIATPAVREILGIDISGGRVYSYFPSAEVIKGLLAIVDDLRSGAKKVGDVYYENQRIEYVGGLSLDKLPDPETRLTERVLLSSLTIAPARTGAEVPKPRDGEGSFSGANGASGDAGSVGSGPGPESASAGTGAPDPAAGQSAGNSGGAGAAQPSGGATTASRPSRVQLPRPRSSTIPKDCILWIRQPRINSLYHELVRLDVEQFTNACSVLLRVFVELTVDHHVDVHAVIPEAQRRNTSLAKKLKELAAHRRAAGVLSEQLEKAVIKIADGNGMFSASTTTFNQYVHNQFAYPQAGDLRTAWNELQPFMMKLWTK